MPLTPEEEKELAALEGGGLSPAEEAELAALEGRAPQSAAPYKSPGEGEGFLSDVKARVTDPNRWKAIAGMDSPAKPDMIAGNTPAVMPGAAAPKALNTLATFLNASAPKRIATGAGVGAASDPENPGMGALKGTGMAIGGEALSKFLSGAAGIPLVRKAGEWLGGGLARLSKETTRDYTANPKLAEELYGLNKHNPTELGNRAREQINRGVTTQYERESKPLLDKLGQKLAPTEIAVDPSQFKGTAAEPIINQSWAKRGQTVRVPGEPDVVKASPLKYEWQTEGHPQLVTPKVESSPLNYEYQPVGNKQLVAPETQFSPVRVDRTGYQPKILPDGPAQQVNPTIETDLMSRRPVPSQPQTELPEVTTQMYSRRSVPQEAVDFASVPRTKEVPAPLPDRVQMTGAQALAAKRAAQEAAQFKYNQNPEVYSAANDAEAIAGSNLRKAMENVAPDTVGINDQLEHATRMSGAAQRVAAKNPANILTDMETNAAVPMRTTREWLDAKGGTNLQQMAKSLGAGKEINKPLDNMLYDMITRPVGKGVLRMSSKLPTKGMDPELAEALSQLAQGKGRGNY